MLDYYNCVNKMVGGTIIVMESLKQSVTWIIHVLEFMRQMSTFSAAIPNELNKMYHLQAEHL